MLVSMNFYYIMNLMLLVIRNTLIDQKLEAQSFIVIIFQNQVIIRGYPNLNDKNGDRFKQE